MKKLTPLELVEKAAQFTTDTPEKIARIYGVDVVKVRQIVAAVRRG
jgi:hypothetical protein